MKQTYWTARLLDEVQGSIFVAGVIAMQMGLLQKGYGQKEEEVKGRVEMGTQQQPPQQQQQRQQ